MLRSERDHSPDEAVSCNPEHLQVVLFFYGNKLRLEYYDYVNLCDKKMVLHCVVMKCPNELLARDIIVLMSSIKPEKMFPPGHEET